MSPHRVLLEFETTQRVLLEFETAQVESSAIQQELIIENEQHHDYTESFRGLTREFYLRF